MLKKDKEISSSSVEDDIIIVDDSYKLYLLKDDLTDF